MYQRDSNKAFENAKSKGLDKPQDFMYMYSIKEKDFFKNITIKLISIALFVPYC